VSQTDPRLGPQSVPPSLADTVREIRRLEVRLANALIAAHLKVWPKEVNGRYVVTHLNGRAKVQFEPPPVKEAGYVD